jgi:hypothetical protein
MAKPDIVLDPRIGDLITHVVRESYKYGFVPIIGMVDPDTWGKVVELVMDSEGAHIARLYPEGDNSWELVNWFEPTTDPDQVLSISVGYVGCDRDEISYISGHWLTQKGVTAEIAMDKNHLTVRAIGRKDALFSAINQTSERLNMVGTEMGAGIEAQDAHKGVDEADAQ